MVRGGRLRWWVAVAARQWSAEGPKDTKSHSCIRERKTKHGAAMGVLEGFWWMPRVVELMGGLRRVGGGCGWSEMAGKTLGKALE